MANLIIDTSILGQRFVKDTHTGHVQVLLREATWGLHSLYMPDFSRTEVVNIIWMHIKRGTIAEEQGESLVRDLKRLPLILVSSKQHELAALAIGVRHNLAIYDALHIAIAKKRKCPLITADAKQSAATSAEGVALKNIADFVPTSQ